MKCQYKRPLREDYVCSEDALPDSKEHFCIFHEQRKEKDTEEFHKKISEKIQRKDFDFAGYFFPDKISFEGVTFTEEANFLGAEFSENADFGDAKFSENAVFVNVTFSGNANFEGAEFSENVDFKNTKFEKNTNFTGANFTKVAYFGNAEFAGETHFMFATFKGLTDFTSAKFTKEAYFMHTTFTGEAKFRGITFLKKADFEKAAFREIANFEGAKFLEEVGFESATFTDAYFWNAKFSGDADFWHAKFSRVAGFKFAEFSGKANFEGAIFNERADFRDAKFTGDSEFVVATFIKEANFLKAEFTEKADFESVKFFGLTDFIDVHFGGEVSFVGAFFSDSTRIRALTGSALSRASFRASNCERVDFLGSSWSADGTEIVIFEEREGIKRGDEWAFSELEEIYRRLKQSHQRFGDHDLAGKFYYREMESRRKHQKKQRQRINWIWSEILRFTCGYGERPRRTAILSGLIITLWAFFYLFGGIVHITNGSETIINYDLTPNLTQLIYDFLWALYTSIITFTSLGYGDLHPTGWGRVAASIEVFIGVFMVALFLFVFTRKMIR